MEQQDDETNSTTVRQLTDCQERFLAVLPLPSACLSLLGSGIIIYIASQSRKRRQWTPYTRLLVAMSVCDILYSISISTSSFMRPRDSSVFVWALGNDASCNASGFLNQLSMSAIFYNAMLSFYFLLTARFGMTRDRFSKRVEPLMHAISIGHPLLTASFGSAKNFYAERRGIMGCWLEFDKACVSEDPEIRATTTNCTFRYTGSIFYALPVGCTLISLVVNNLIISRFVTNKVKPPRKKLRDSKAGSFTTSFKSSGLTLLNTSGRTADVDNSGRSALDTSETSALDVSTRSDEKLSIAASMRTETVNLSPSNTSSNNDSMAIQKAQNRRLKLVRSQAFLFVASYLLCNIWGVIMTTGDFLARSEEAELEMMVKYYPVALLQALFLPLQGLFNMFVFVRPKYLKYRHDFPWESKYWAFRRSVFGDTILPTSYRRSVAAPSKPNQDQLHPINEDTLREDANSPSSSISKHFQKRENLSTLTASVGDFDHVIDHDSQDERWSNNSAENLSWVPTRRSRHTTPFSGNRRSSLEVISETAESVFEPFPPPANLAREKEEKLPPAELSVNAEQKERRWSSESSPTQRIRKSVPARIQNSENDAFTTPESPASRWSSGYNDLPEPSSPILPLPMRAESLNDEEGQSPSSSSSSDSSPKIITPNGRTMMLDGSGHSVSSTSSTSSVDSPLMPPQRKLSPLPFVNNDLDDDSDDE